MIASIGIAAALITVGFNSVVAVNTHKTALTEKTPLFKLRSTQASEQDKKSIKSQYIGKGEQKISIPMPNMGRILNQILSKTKGKLKDRLDNILTKDKTNDQLKNALHRQIKNNPQLQGMFKKYINEPYKALKNLQDLNDNNPVPAFLGLIWFIICIIIAILWHTMIPTCPTS